MLPHYRALCPLFFIVLTLGCGGRTTQPSKYAGNFNGVSFEVYGFGQQNTHVVAEDDVVVTNGSSRLNLKNGRIVANGKDHGPVKKGDTVVLGADGHVSVNNSPRTPSEMDVRRPPPIL
jgi:hypothetical protein